MELYGATVGLGLSGWRVLSLVFTHASSQRIGPCFTDVARARAISVPTFIVSLITTIVSFMACFLAKPCEVGFPTGKKHDPVGCDLCHTFPFISLIV